MSTADGLSRRLADVTAKTPGQRERLAEITARIEDAAPQCGFHARNPFTGTIGRCASPAETAVIVAAMTPDGTSNGDGVRAEVCRHHADELKHTYQAPPAPADAGDAPG